MKILFLGVGKTKFSALAEMEEIFSKRISHYCKFEYRYLELHKKWNKLPPSALKKKEAELVLNSINPKDHLILLDEKAKQFDSIEFAKKIENFSNRSINQIVFLVGGAFGFDDSLYQRAQEKISLSKMTFSHQIIRSIFLEQLYRGFTIINNESYHNI